MLPKTAKGSGKNIMDNRNKIKVQIDIEWLNNYISRFIYEVIVPWLLDYSE